MDENATQRLSKTKTDPRCGLARAPREGARGTRSTCRRRGAAREPPAFCYARLKHSSITRTRCPASSDDASEPFLGTATTALSLSLSLSHSHSLSISLSLSLSLSHTHTHTLISCIRCATRSIVCAHATKKQLDKNECEHAVHSTCTAPSAARKAPGCAVRCAARAANQPPSETTPFPETVSPPPPPGAWSRGLATLILHFQT